MEQGLRRFEGKVAVITGGATGVGLAVARRLASEGARVVITGRRAEVGTKAVDSLRAAGFEALFVPADVADAEQVRNLMDLTVQTYGQIDILVNNAAIFTPGRFMATSWEEWRKIFDVIVSGTYFCTKEAASRMIEQGVKGKIVNVSSINSSRALEESSHYNAGKGALDQLTRNTALELMEHGIRVNSVALGFIETPMSVVDGVNEHETDWFKDIYVGRKKIPQQRQGQPEEAAGVIAFLASEDASYMCGAVVPVDGGLSITF
ncbi:SDR family NAD(P)-dependent oxidoreductase [Paenibacillus thermotolerans]|uniref:SDR family NAD(P)-dependent oxidoreductase n=1 Tax=Paenibacillus thermotolerans TaxID=3027807 RepID=UPI002367FAAC|nr:MULTISPECIES: SDR family NAD(P)-dependent oxidoreductase [unclassified Paenibacillus]